LAQVCADASITARIYAHSQDEALRNAGKSLGGVDAPIAVRSHNVVAQHRLLAPTAHADPDGDAPSITQEICGAFDLGVPPGDIPGRLGQNDGRWNYWRAQQRTSQTIVSGDCDN
jgi:hypothetical protein